MEHLFKCEKCNKYTMKEICDTCNSKTTNPRPAKFSPEDQWADYRRKAKMQQWKEKGFV